eukprot:gene9316-11418_t
MEAPCPEKIWTDAGAAFGIGCIGSAMVSSVGSFLRPVPVKGTPRLVFTYDFVRKNAPRYGGNFAVWGTLFSSIDCTLVYIRKKEDSINPIVAGALTGGILAARGGWRSSVQAAALGGIFIGLIEVAQTVIAKYMMHQDQMMQQMMQQQQQHR